MTTESKPYAELFTEEYNRQLTALPHTTQAAIMSMPGGYDARRLAISVEEALNARGIYE